MEQKSVSGIASLDIVNGMYNLFDFYICSRYCPFLQPPQLLGLSPGSAPQTSEKT